jgi:hypothetical protein
MKNVWPAFICDVLSNAVITGHCSVDLECDGCTFQWNGNIGWIDDFAMLHVGDEGISMEVPKSVFEEITEMQYGSMQSLNELKLGDL